jgi:lipoprotein-releasing system permease protein
MYKFLLSLRYLRTRYIALASIVSVMLGVATMIVVNSVMAGFQAEMYKRLHSILSDIVVEAHSLEGIENPDAIMAAIREELGADLEAMTPNVHVPAMLTFSFRGHWMTKQINLIGIDRDTYSQVSDFGKYLLHPDNREKLGFDLLDAGYDPRIGAAGWSYRREMAARQKLVEDWQRRQGQAQPVGPTGELPADPFAGGTTDESVELFDPAKEQHAGIILGLAIANIHSRDSDGNAIDQFLIRPGDDVKISFPKAGTPPDVEHSTCTVVDFYESKMSEYDASFAFLPLDELQKLRGMMDPATGLKAVTAIQIRLAPGADLIGARERLRARFPAYSFPYHVQTWKDLQGPLLAAVELETTLLNILLFLIIAVAGFGILATFFMIVVEKTRDIGILKALGASNMGVMSIFLGYGLSLGIAGASVGLILGLAFVMNINVVRGVVERITGREVFDPSIYYFQEIPTIIEPWTVAWVMGGAIGIAVVASVLPAIRAARLHPVRALRFE